MKKRKQSIFNLVLSALLFLSACGAEKPASEDDQFAKLNRLAAEIIIDNSETYGSMVEDSYLEAVIDKICYGSFSQIAADEIFVECKLLNMPHAGGLDSRIGIVLKADTLEMIAFREFFGDEVMISCLQNTAGQSRIFVLRGTVSLGFRGAAAELFAIQDGEFVEIPAGDFTELPPIEENGGDFIYYMMGGSRLAVSWESFPKLRPEQMRMPAQLEGIYVWEPYKEQFVLDSRAEQPMSENSGIRELAWLAVETVLENTGMEDLDPLSTPLNIVIDQISLGSFSGEKANEMFVVCKIFPTIYAETCDRLAGILFDRDTLQLAAYKEFEAEGAELRCLETGNGQKRILYLSNAVCEGQTTAEFNFKLYAVRDGEWVEIPVEEEMGPEEDSGW